MAKSIVMDQEFDDYRSEKMVELQAASEERGKEFNEAAAEKAIAKGYLQEFVTSDSNMEIVSPIADALRKLFTRTRKESGERNTSKNLTRKAVRELILATGSASEMEVFEKSMWGRAEMKDFIKASIKCAPEDRAWIELVSTPDEPMGTYFLKGTGPDAPDGWEGYMPVEETVEL